MLATDGVFSMDGDLAPLRDLALLSRVAGRAAVRRRRARRRRARPRRPRQRRRRQPVARARCRCCWCRWARRFGGQGALLFGQRSAGRARRGNRAALPVHHRAAAGDGGGDARRAATDPHRTLAAREADVAGGALPPHGTARRAAAAGVVHADPADAWSATTQRALAMSAALRAARLPGRGDPSADACPRARRGCASTLSALHGERDVDALVGALAASVPGSVARRSLKCTSSDDHSSMHIESRGSGPDLVLVHGWAMHGGVFAPLVERLAPRFTPAPGRPARPRPQRRQSSRAGAGRGRRQPGARACRARPGWAGRWAACSRCALALRHPERVRGLALLCSPPALRARRRLAAGHGRRPCSMTSPRRWRATTVPPSIVSWCWKRKAPTTAQSELQLLRSQVFAPASRRRRRSRKAWHCCATPTCAPICRRWRCRACGSPAAATAWCVPGRGAGGAVGAVRALRARRPRRPRTVPQPRRRGRRRAAGFPRRPAQRVAA